MPHPRLADPVVRSKLDEFRLIVEELVHADFVTNGDRVMVIRELCELSRSTKFDLGPLTFANPDQAEEVARTFQAAAEKLRGIWTAENIPDEADKFISNIERRAQRCRVES